MDQGGSREGVYRALVLDRDYQGMENYDKQISGAGAEFAHLFSNRFAEMDINKETLIKVNFYSVKRLITEKALEIIDAFEKEEDLFQWYLFYLWRWRVIINTRLKMKSGKIKILMISLKLGQVSRQ